MVEVEVKKWGNSKAVIVPSEIADLLGLEVGDRLEADFVKKKELSGFGILKGKRPFKREKDWDLREL